jgi:hypothetical protein
MSGRYYIKMASCLNVPQKENDIDKIDERTSEMAKPKRKLIIKKCNDIMFYVYYINPTIAIQAIRTIEGIQYTGMEGDAVDVWINPLYDVDDIIQEVKDLLLAEVPDIFKEN